LHRRDHPVSEVHESAISSAKRRLIQHPLTAFSAGALKLLVRFPAITALDTLGRNRIRD
jgi:hypothetical protein